MTRGELDIAVDWAAAEGWNPGLYDADCFYHADPTGFLMGFLDGEPLASISAIKYGDSFGFIGFYIVKPEFRGQGHGLALWHAALESLKGRNVGLDGVVAQQENYVKSGFSLAYRQIRYEGLGGGISAASSCTPLAALPVEKVVEYDRQFFPEVRSHFIQCWVIQPHHHAIAIVKEQTLVGYGVLRPCRSGYKIGPLFADTATMADAIFRTLVANVPPGQPFYLDVPEVNSAAIALAEHYEMRCVFETARMYTQSAPQLPLNKIFGVTTFELG
ncbi:n-acetyltransferase gcn5 [Leptolyngbya sp. Heron Island J]|nr:n-acetyltransferase gcn5 [Leptolyngbya sp. Heron Island J]